MSSAPRTTASSKHSQAHRIFDKIRSYWNGLPPVNIPVAATFRVRRSEYHQLLQLLSQDEELQDFAFRRLKLYYNRARTQAHSQQDNQYVNHVYRSDLDQPAGPSRPTTPQEQTPREIVGLSQCGLPQSVGKDDDTCPLVPV